MNGRSESGGRSTDGRTPDGSLTRVRRLQSIRVRLPIAIAALLATVIGVFAFAAHEEVRRSQLAAARDRVEVAARFLARTSAEQAASRLAAMRELSGSEGLETALEGPLDEVTRDILESFVARGGEGAAMALFDGSGRSIWSSPPGEVKAILQPVDAGGGLTPIELSGEGRVVTQAQVPVGEDGQGLLVFQSEVTGKERTTAALEDLLGEGASAVVGNADGSLWTDMAAVVPPPPSVALSALGAGEYVREGANTVIGAVATIPSTPWALAVEFPRELVLAPAHAFLRFALGLGVALLVLGGASGWLFSSRITRRLDRLRNAADAIALGDYQHRVDVEEARDEIRVLATAFNDMGAKVMQSRDHLHRIAENLRRSNAELEQFAYTASHDLQEPLRMVSSYVQLLARRYQGSLDDEADEFIGFAVDGAQRMKLLIDGLLHLSRVERRPPSCREVALSEIVASAMTDLQPMIRETGAQVRYGDLPILWADPVMIRQVFENLLCNALKFKSDGAPQIEIDAEPMGREWLIHVRDNGVGFEPEKSEEIFQVFRRLHTRQEYEGTGIGLAVCKRMVNRWGGRIWAESRPGQGSLFSFTMPAYRGGWEGLTAVEMLDQTSGASALGMAVPTA